MYNQFLEALQCQTWSLLIIYCGCNDTRIYYTKTICFETFISVYTWVQNKYIEVLTTAGVEIHLKLLVLCLFILVSRSVKVFFQLMCKWNLTFFNKKNKVFNFKFHTFNYEFQAINAWIYLWLNWIN